MNHLKNPKKKIWINHKSPKSGIWHESPNPNHDLDSTLQGVWAGRESKRMAGRVHMFYLSRAFLSKIESAVDTYHIAPMAIIAIF